MEAHYKNILELFEAAKKTANEYNIEIPCALNKLIFGAVGCDYACNECAKAIIFTLYGIETGTIKL